MAWLIEPICLVAQSGYFERNAASDRKLMQITKEIDGVPMTCGYVADDSSNCCFEFSATSLCNICTQMDVHKQLFPESCVFDVCSTSTKITSRAVRSCLSASGMAACGKRNHSRRSICSSSTCVATLAKSRTNAR